MLSLTVAVSLALSSTSTALVPPRASSCPPTSLCVDRCCPPGQVYTGQELGKTCITYQNKIDYHPETDPTFKPREVSLLGEEKFECSDGAFLVSATNLFDPEKYSLTSSGQLRVFLNNTYHEDFNYGDFCVAFTKINQSSYEIKYEEEIKTTYSVCYEFDYEFEDDEIVVETVYPVAIFISDTFVFITLAVYLGLSELRNQTFGRITIGFLINVFLSFLFIGVHYSLDIRINQELFLDTPGCILLGYLIQHTLVAVFFWISAMSIFITRTILNSFTEEKSDNPTKTLLLNTAYAQGSAALVTLITCIMDIAGDPQKNIIPNIGSFKCWLGTEDPKVPFSSSPEFLYFYLIIIFVILINVACFLRTGFALFSHWWQMRGLAQGSINELFKTQLVTLAKLFIIMGG